LQQLQLRQFHSLDVTVHPDGRYVAAALTFHKQEAPSIQVVCTQMTPHSAPNLSGVCVTIPKEKKTLLLILQNCIYLFVCFFLSFFMVNLATV
jgi:hypothetical protein